MKNLFITFSLLALMVCAGSAAYAQEAETDETASAETKVAEATVIATDSHLSVDLSIDNDEELTTNEKFELARKAIKENISEEFAAELENEIDGLSDDEKERLVSALEDGLTFNINGMDGNGIPLSVLFIAVPAVLLTLGMPVIIVLLVLWFGHKKRRQRLELINRFLDAGKDVPAEILHSVDNDGGNSLRRGIMLTGIGLGIVAGFSAVGENDIAGFGLIPMFIGIARLVYWYLAERKQSV